MSFNVTPYLKDIDNEIAHHRETIARLRLKVSELEDMRLLIMSREEYRSAVNGRGSPFGELVGAEIAVRDTPALPKPRKSSRAKLRHRIVELLSDRPMTSTEIGDALALPKGDQFRKPMSNCLYNMRRKGMVDLVGSSGPGKRDGRYSLSKEAG